MPTNILNNKSDFSFLIDLILIWLKNVKTLAKIWIRISQGLIARVNSYYCFTDFFAYRPPPASASIYSDRSRWVLHFPEVHLTTSVHSFPLKNHLQFFPISTFHAPFLLTNILTHFSIRGIISSFPPKSFYLFSFILLYFQSNFSVLLNYYYGQSSITILKENQQSTC